MIDKKNIQYFPDQTQALEAAGDAISAIFKKYVNSPKLFLSAGGSALEILDFVDEHLLDQTITVSVLDERFSQDPKVSNYLQLENTSFFEFALKQDCNFLGTLPKPDDTAQSLAQRHENSLREWKKENPQGKIIATFGMGPDGHIAGIFPFVDDKTAFEKLFNSEAWVIGYEALGKHKYPNRVTTTLTFFKEVDEAIVFICGKEKALAFKKLINRQGKIYQLPALGVYLTKHCQIFTDINL